MDRQRLPRFAAITLSLPVVLLALARPALGIPISWNNASGGNWNTPGNWSPAQVPASGDDVTIDLDGTYTVTINTNPSVASLTLGAASGTQTLLAASRTITVAGAFVVSANGSIDFSTCTLNGAGSLSHSGSSSRLVTTTVQLPITNDGTLHVQRGGTWNGAYTSGAGSTLRIESEAGSSSTLTVASGFTNDGTLELTTINNTGSSGLTWSSGTLTNPAGSSILLSAGTGGARTLTGQLSNAGTITVNAATTLAGSGADHVNAASGTIDLIDGNLTISQTGTTPTFTNNGAINVPIGRTLTVSGGGFVHASTGLAGAGTFSISSVTLTQSVDYETGTLPIAVTSSVLNGPGIFRNSSGVTTLMYNFCTVNSAIVNDGTLRVQRSGTWNGACTTGAASTLRIESESGSSSTLTVASGFTNNGTLELTTVNNAGASALTWNSGTLTNAAGSSILLSAGTGGTRTLTGQLSNSGTITVNAATTLTGASTDHVNTASGVIDLVAGNLTLNPGGVNPSFTNDGTITVPAGRTLTVTSGEFVHASAALSGAGNFTISSGTLTQTVDYETGVLAISVTSSTLKGPGTFRNSSGVTALLYSGCVVNSPIVNDGTLRVQRGGSFNGPYASGVGSTLKVESESGASSTLSVASGFTNNGTLELTTINSTGPSALVWNSGTLTNAAGASILLSAGTGGTRTLTGQLSNAGTLTVNAGSTLSGGGNDHVNSASGVIDLVAGNLTITQGSVSPSFTNVGTINVPGGRTLTLTNGEFVHASTGLAGAGTFSITNVTLTQSVDYDTGTLPITVANSILNGPGTFRNASGVTTILYNSCTANCAIVNDGTLRVQRSGTWNGAYTSGAGSVLKVESEGGTSSTLTVASGFTNHGTLELTTLNSSGPSALSWSSGTLTNAAGSSILLSAGTGGARTLTGQLSNSGGITVNAATTLAGSGADHLNAATGSIDLVAGNLTVTQTGVTPTFTDSGAIAVPAGRTLTVTGGAFVHASPGLAGAGTFSISNVTLIQSVDYVTGTLPIAVTSSILIGPGTFRNSSGVNTLLYSFCNVNSAIVNDGTLRVQRSGTWNGSYTSGEGSTLKVESELGATSTLTVASAFTNHGTIELTSVISSGPSALTWSSGTLSNPAGSNVLCSAGSGGTRTLTGPLSNDGTITVNAGSTFAGQLLNSGTITVNAASSLTGAGADHVNSSTGSIDLVAGNLTITQTGTTPTFTNEGAITVATGRTLTVSGGEFVHSSASLSGAGAFSISIVTLTQNVDYVSGSLALSASQSTLNGPGTFRNTAGVTSVLYNFCVVNSALVNDGTLRVQRSGTFNGAYTSGAGSTLKVESELGGSSTLTVASGFTNNGSLELTAISNSGPASLTWSSGTLTNAAGSTLLLSAGTGGTRALTGQLSNAGTITVNAATTLAGAGADHVNGASGLIELNTGNLTVTQTGTTPSLTDSGAVAIGAGRTLTVTGGAFAHMAGSTLRGNGTLNIAGTTFTNGGNIDPGASAGSLTITGPCPVASTGAIHIELGGASPGTQYDRLTVSGALTLNAPIHVSLINGFLPTPGQSFQVVNFGALIQSSNPSYVGLDVGNGISLVPEVSATSITLKAVGQSWVRLFPTGASPLARERHAATYNPSSNRMIVFGGLSDAGPRNDIWVLRNADGQAATPVWQQLSPTGSPPSAREGHSVVYDVSGNRLIVFGGDNAAGTPVANAEVWVLTGADGTAGTPSWTQLSPDGTPPAARTAHGAVYDAGSNRMIVFGGDDSPPCGSGLNDVWVLSNANGLGGTPEWSQLAPGGTPPGPRSHAITTYDAATNRMTVIGGLVPCGASNEEMWVLADANGIGSPAWSQASPSGSPPTPWSLQSGVYDPGTNRVTTFGGLVGGVPDDRALTLTDGNGTGSPAWVDFAPLGNIPPPRSLHSAVQANGHRMVVFGGAGESERLADVWVLAETQALVVSVPEEPVVAAPKSWRTGFSRVPSPNPASSSSRFAIALSRAQRVDLAILDVTGRRVSNLQHGWLDAGEHAFDWAGSTDSGGQAPAGLYFLVLETEERREVRRLTLAR